MPTERATDQPVKREGIDAAAGDSSPSRSIEKTRMETYVVIPAYHEAECIAQVARTIGVNLHVRKLGHPRLQPA